MTDEKTTAAGQVIFGKDHHPALVRAYTMLTAPLGDKTTWIRFGEMLTDPLIASVVSDCRVYPSILEAAFASEGLGAYRLLEELECFYAGDDDRVPTAPLATVLGLFQGVRCYEENDRAMMRYYLPKLEPLLMRFIFDETACDAIQVPAEKQRGMLSEAVSGFLRVDKDETANVAQRRAWALDLLRKVDERLSSEAGRTLTLAGFGEVLVNEFSYKLFGSLGVWGRARAMSQFFKSMAPSSS